jgi:hypothetical protein
MSSAWFVDDEAERGKVTVIFQFFDAVHTDQQFSVIENLIRCPDVFIVAELYDFGTVRILESQLSRHTTITVVAPNLFYRKVDINPLQVVLVSANRYEHWRSLAIRQFKLEWTDLEGVVTRLLPMNGDYPDRASVFARLDIVVFGRPLKVKRILSLSVVTEMWELSCILDVKIC